MRLQITFPAVVRGATEKVLRLARILFGEQVRQSCVSGSLARVGHWVDAQTDRPAGQDDRSSVTGPSSFLGFGQASKPGRVRSYTQQGVGL